MPGQCLARFLGCRGAGDCGFRFMASGSTPRPVFRVAGTLAITGVVPLPARPARRPAPPSMRRFWRPAHPGAGAVPPTRALLVQQRDDLGHIHGLRSHPAVSAAAGCAWAGRARPAPAPASVRANGHRIGNAPSAAASRRSGGVDHQLYHAVVWYSPPNRGLDIACTAQVGVIQDITAHGEGVAHLVAGADGERSGGSMGGWALR